MDDILQAPLTVMAYITTRRATVTQQQAQIRTYQRAQALVELQHAIECAKALQVIRPEKRK